MAKIITSNYISKSSKRPGEFIPRMLQEDRTDIKINTEAKAETDKNE